MKTSELTGTALDWAVAVADKRNFKFSLGGSLEVRARTEYGDELPIDALDLWMYWNPSTNWAQGGPIVEREKITLDYDCNSQGLDLWAARKHAYDGTLLWEEFGPTPLTAAMRCFVASKLGDEIEFPKVL